MNANSLYLQLGNFLERYYGLIVILGICLGIQLSGLQSVFEYRRDNLFSHPQQLLFCHFTHITWIHLAVNALALLAINYLFFQDRRPSYVLSIVFILAMAVSIGLYLLSSDVQWYRGLSGVLHGLFVVGCISMFRKEKIAASLLLSAILAKLIWEQLSSDHLSTMLGGSLVIVDAHLWGSVAGFLLSGGLALRKNIRHA